MAKYIFVRFRQCEVIYPTQFPPLLREASRDEDEKVESKR